MNKQNILAIADAIENSTLARRRTKAARVGFSMESYAAQAGVVINADKTGHNCGTVGCIAGWTVALFNEDGTPRTKPLTGKGLLDFYNANAVEDVAGDILGLEYWQYQQLFVPEHLGLLRDITTAQAVCTLRRLARTGDVVWK